MAYYKRYGVYIERPGISEASIFQVIDRIYKLNMVPIIVLYSGYTGNKYLNIHNKIDLIRKKNPYLREDNFKIMTTLYSENIKPTLTGDNAKFKWKSELLSLIKDINVHAFGTSDKSLDDKIIITNINRFYMYGNQIFLSEKIDNVISDFIQVCDIMNIKTDNDKVYDPYLSMLIRKRDINEIYWDDSKDRVFSTKFSTIASNKTYIHMIDREYLELIEKYDLGKILNGFIKTFTVDSKDLDTTTRFLSMNNINFNIGGETSFVGKKHVDEFGDSAIHQEIVRIDIQ